MDTKMIERPEPFIVEPTSKHNQTVIWLHGTSSSGLIFAQEFLSFKFWNPAVGSKHLATEGPTSFQQVELNATALHESKTSPRKTNVDVSSQLQTITSALPTTKLIFPSGTYKPVTILGGKITNAWFDIHDFGNRTKGEQDQENKQNMRESSEYLTQVVRDEYEVLNRGWTEESGRKRRKVVLAGFSQGTAVGVLALLGGRFADLVSTFIGIGGWCPFKTQIDDFITDMEINRIPDIPTKEERRAYVKVCINNEDIVLGEIEKVMLEEGIGKDVKFWLAHGKLDKKVKIEWGREMVRVVVKAGYEVEWNEVEGLGHDFRDVGLMNALVGVLQSESHSPS